MERFKGRSVQEGMLVSVHLNLHKKRYAITALEGPDKGRVLGYSDHFSLRDATFKINRLVQKRVRVNRVKEVHAWVIGRYVSESRNAYAGAELYYNPYHTDAFVDRESRNEVQETDWVWFSGIHMRYQKQ